MNERQHFWHPFADMPQVPGHELVLARGQGAWLFGESGRRYLLHTPTAEIRPLSEVNVFAALRMLQAAGRS